MPKKPGAVIRTKKYHRFRGVDFSTDPALVDDTRSPWAPNLTADMGGMPEKRPGWRTLRRFEGQINGLFQADFDDVRHLLVHTGQSSTAGMRTSPSRTSPSRTRPAGRSRRSWRTVCPTGEARRCI